MNENADRRLLGRQPQFLYEATRLVLKKHISENFFNDECEVRERSETQTQHKRYIFEVEIQKGQVEGQRSARVGPIVWC
jgi:hypothetical protein